MTSESPNKSTPSVKFLIIRFSSIGDIVLTTPVVRCLKTQVEGAQVFYLTKRQFAPILQSNPYIDKIFMFDGNLAENIQAIKQEGIHYVIDLHKSIRSSQVKNKLKLVSFSFNKINPQKWLMVNFKINRLPNKHIVERYLETTRLFDVKNDSKGLDYFIPEKDKISLGALPKGFQDGYVGFVIGAKHNTKKLDTDKIVSIIDKIKHPVVLLGGKEDAENGDKIQNLSKGIIFNACGKYNINQSASLVQQCKLLITHDTGLMHVAAAFKKNVLSVWGNTIPGFGMYPYQPGKYSKLFEINGLSCRPCSKLGKLKCPKKHFKCMQDMDEAEVAEYANRVWGEIAD